MLVKAEPKDMFRGYNSAHEPRSPRASRKRPGTLYTLAYSYTVLAASAGTRTRNFDALVRSLVIEGCCFHIVLLYLIV